MAKDAAKEVVILNNRSEAVDASPMMTQYIQMRDQYEGYIMLYRLGDFYECFFEDALAVSRALGLTLTGRDCGHGRRAAMCGVPFHKADLYIGRLVERGFKVAVCEQTEDPKAAVGLVKREVTQLITPGTITDNTILSEGQNNFLMAAVFGNNSAGLAFADISTGEFSVTYLSGDSVLERLASEASVFHPSEIIINEKSEEMKASAELLKEKFGTVSSFVPAHAFDYEKTRERVIGAFGTESDRLSEPETVMALGALIYYIGETQKCTGGFVRELNIYSTGQYLELDLNTRRNLELVETMRTKEKRGSLLWVIDKTKTAMGARLLRQWVLQPLINPAQITRRQSAVGAFEEDLRFRESVGEILENTLDIERLTARAVYGSANAKDLRAIYQSISRLPELKEIIAGKSSDCIKEIHRDLDTLDDIAALIDAAIVDDPPFSVREGGMIKEGYNSDVDYYRMIKDNSKNIMQAIEEREKEATGIRTLKVTSNKVFGFYIEVSKSFTDQVPERYIRKQTLTNCERYITAELKEMEDTVLGADEKVVTLEYDILSQIRETIAKNADRIRKSAQYIAELDVFRSLGEVASRQGYVCPEINLSTELYIKDGRHPVVERFVTDSYFVPNDTVLDTENNKVMIITGPNMAGKSTYMRQVAVITVLAQIGSFVPAREARIGIVDKLFTRVGASDDLASGQSTFMLEMNEVAAILRSATKRSLIIYDEVGRGTSTFDGMAIAKAVIEYTHSKKVGAKTLFATHYHELTSMEDELPGVVNYNIAAKKRGDSITFLRKIVRGGTDDSYGIEVAKLAGVPREVVNRAREILAEIESGALKCASPATKSEGEAVYDLFTGLGAEKEAEVSEKIKSTDLNTITPIEAMTLLFELKKMLD